jgi:hypothetical protein
VGAASWDIAIQQSIISFIIPLRNRWGVVQASNDNTRSGGSCGRNLFRRDTKVERDAKGPFSDSTYLESNHLLGFIVGGLYRNLQS